jgi:hypothetical protein
LTAAGSKAANVAALPPTNATAEILGAEYP